MLWYNNPEAVAIHQQAIKERYEEGRPRTAMRLVKAGGATERY